jgi:hypothetical protein
MYGRIVKHWTLEDNFHPTSSLPLPEVAPGRYSLRLLFPEGWQQRPVIVAR